MHTAPVAPQNLEAEEAVIGALMMVSVDSTLFDLIAQTGLRPDDFYFESHGRIYQAQLALHARGEPTDAITLTDELDRRGTLEDVGGRVRLHELATLVPATANAPHYARIVTDTAQRRALITLGGELTRLGRDAPGDTIDILEAARALTSEIGESRVAVPIEMETWAQFERSATEQIPTLVDELWPEAALGFIAAPPKKGKTWVGLDLAISVATGTPFLARFPVPQPAPVVYLALEGHRAAIRGRIGCMARGHGLDPHQPIANLHVIYKPRGLNLNDPAWIRTVRDAVDRVHGRLLIVDVLRRAAVLKENSNDEWNEFVGKLDPFSDAGCAVALLHHFGKLTEITKERAPGERMAGAGAMYGAFDVGVFITGSDDGARRLRVEFETRDLAAPEQLAVYLAGNPSGKNGGFIFTDTATWTIDDHPGDDHLAGNTGELIEWLDKQPGRRATTDEIRLGFDLSERQIRDRRIAWQRAGVVWEPARGGKPASYLLLQSWTTSEQDDNVGLPTSGTQETLDMQELPDEKLGARHSTTSTNVAQPKTPDLQGKEQGDEDALSYGEVATADAAQPHRPQPEPASTWLL